MPDQKTSSASRLSLSASSPVASGGADAGFGLRAAAAEYGLDFVPLLREHYYLAARARDVARLRPLGLADESRLHLIQHL